MTFVNLGSQGQHWNEITNQMVSTLHPRDKITMSLPSDRRCVGAGSPSPCWWWRRCRARWWGPPSRTDWGSLGGRRKEVSQEVRMELIFHLLRLSGTLEVASPSSSCVQPEGPVVGLNLAGRGLGRSRTWGCWAAEDSRRAAWSPAS